MCAFVTVFLTILRLKFSIYCYFYYKSWHHVISMNSASQFRLFPTYLLSVSLLVMIWSYAERGYNSTTEHFVWLVRSPGTVYHCTFFLQLYLQKHAQDTSFFHVPTSLTVFRVRAANIVQRPCSDSSHVTYKLS